MVQLTAANSSDPEGDELTFEWTQIDGAAVTLSHASSNSPHASFLSLGTESTLTFQVRVTDPGGVSDSDTVTIVFVNGPPVADAGSNQRVDLSGGAVNLSAAKSSDPDGDELTFEWVQVGGPAVEYMHHDLRAVTIRFRGPRFEETFRFEVRVTDPHGAFDSDSVAISFENSAPQANAGKDLMVGRGEQVMLDGGGSRDQDRQDLTYAWTQAAGEPVALSDPSVERPSFTAPIDPGQLTFTLTVSDGFTSHSDKVVITIANRRPTAVAKLINGNSVGLGDRVTLDGSESSDPDGDPITYAWSQHSGDPVTLSDARAATATFRVPDRAQSLSFKLTVSDGTSSATTSAIFIYVRYEPVVASNFATAMIWTPVLYEATEDVFTDDVRTDVRMVGSSDDLLLDVVCFAGGGAAMGFRLLGFDRPERDVGVPDELVVTWRVNDGPVRRESLEVTFLGDTPALYFEQSPSGFDEDWPQVLDGGELAVRIGYRGVQEEVFDLDAFAQTPVHGNLVNCGSY